MQLNRIVTVNTIAEYFRTDCNILGDKIRKKKLNRRGGRGLAEAWMPGGELLKEPEPCVNCRAIVEEEDEEVVLLLLFSHLKN